MFYWGKLTHLKKLYEKVKAEKSQDKLEKNPALEDKNLNNCFLYLLLVYLIKDKVIIMRP